MKEIKLTVLPGVYMRRDPAERGPVVFEIPRSGAEMPRWFAAEASVSSIRQSISSYVEELYADVTDANATWLYACFPNIVIDANRNELDIDPQQLDGAWPEPLQPSDKSRAGSGLIATVASGAPLYGGKLPSAEAARRLRELYRPYHEQLGRLLADAKARTGAAWHLSCHSMGAYPPAGAADAGLRRCDFDLGDRNGTTCEPGLTDAVASCLRGFGYEVSINKHFVGAEAVRKHGDPANAIHSLQIEMNRSLYMDEQTREKSPGFDRVKQDMTRLAEAVGGYARSMR